MKIFFTSFIQVFFVSANTYMITQKNYLGILICSFLISLLWTINVKNISVSNTKQKIIYASGAACGSIFGVIISSTI